MATSAKITSLSGKKLRRNDLIHQHFVDWMRVNDNRGIKGVVVLAIFDDGSWQTGWQWPEAADGGFPWGMAARGALLAAIDDIGSGSHEVDFSSREDE